MTLYLVADYRLIRGFETLFHGRACQFCRYDGVVDRRRRLSSSPPPQWLVQQYRVTVAYLLLPSAMHRHHQRPLSLHCLDWWDCIDLITSVLKEITDSAFKHVRD